MTDIDDRAIGLPVGAQLSGADQKSRHLLDRTLGRGESDARQSAPGEGLEALERQRQVQAALAADHRVDLIHDDAAHAREHGAPGLRAEEDVERLRSGDHDVRGAPAHALPLVLRRVAGPHEGADLDIGQLHRAQLVADTGERRLEVAPDVVGKRLERGDVDDVRLVPESAALQSLAHQQVDRGQEGRECLAGARGRRDQSMPACLDRGPGELLRRRRRFEGALEPAVDGGVEGRL